MDLIDKVRATFKRNRFLTYGVPFLCLVVGGPFVLQHFSQIKFKYYRDASKVKPEELRELERMKVKPDVTLEEAYETVKNMDIDNWEQIRGPRPWEEPETLSQTKRK